MTEPQAWALIAQTLDRLERKVDAALTGLNDKIDGKADKDDVLRLDTRIGEQRLEIEKRIVALENDSASGSGVTAFIGRFWVGCSAAAGLGALVVLVVEKIT